MATQLYDILGTRYPFGRGTTSVTISSDTLTRKYCNGTSGSPTLTLNGAGFTNGTLVGIRQVTGITAYETNWEVAKISSGGGTTTLTLASNLTRNYTTSGASKAEVVEIPEYTDATLNAFTVSPWNGNTGGIYFIACRGTLTVNGALNFAGSNGTATNSDTGGAATGGGFRGGWNSTDNSNAGAGEGFSYDTGSWPVEGTGRQGNGGGGAAPGGVYFGRGAGGGHASQGYNGANGAQFGTACGLADLTSLHMGGGGGGAMNRGDVAGGGASGGAIFVCWAKYFVIGTGSLNLNGGIGGDGGSGNDGGHAAGGACLINCYQATLGTGITAVGGTGYGLSASDGIIRLNYYSGYSGETNPVKSAAQNPRLRIPGVTPFISG